MTLPKGERMSECPPSRITIDDRNSINVVERKIEVFGFTIYRNVVSSKWLKEKDE